MIENKNGTNAHDTSLEVPSIRTRWINCQMHEIVLPNDVHILTDPYVKPALPGHCEQQRTDFSVENLERVDYVIIQHTHFDHDFSVGEVSHRFPKLVVLSGSLTLFYDSPP